MRSIATTSLYSSTTQITVWSRRGSPQIRHRSASDTLKQTAQNFTRALTSTSTSARRRTSTGSAWSRWNAIRCALLGPTPGSRPELVDQVLDDAFVQGRRLALPGRQAEAEPAPTPRAPAPGSVRPVWPNGFIDSPTSSSALVFASRNAATIRSPRSSRSTPRRRRRRCPA